MTLTSPTSGYVETATKTVTVAAQGSAVLAADPLNSASTGANKAIYVFGTGGNDMILVGVNSAGMIQVAVNYVIVGIYSPSQVGHFVVYGLGGNDTIAVSSLLTQTAWLFGGTGTGTDTIIAGGGPTLMIGGAGTNKFTTGAGPSLIVQQPSSVETDWQVLDALMAQWETGHSVSIPP